MDNTFNLANVAIIKKLLKYAVNKLYTQHTVYL